MRFFGFGKQSAYIEAMYRVGWYGDSDDVMCRRHHRPRLISNPMDNRVQQQSSKIDACHPSLPTGTRTTPHLFIHYRRAGYKLAGSLACQYFDTLLVRSAAHFMRMSTNCQSLDHSAVQAEFQHLIYSTTHKHHDRDFYVGRLKRNFVSLGHMKLTKPNTGEGSLIISSWKTHIHVILMPNVNEKASSDRKCSRTLPQGSEKNKHWHYWFLDWRKDKAGAECTVWFSSRTETQNSAWPSTWHIITLKGLANFRRPLKREITQSDRITAYANINDTYRESVMSRIQIQKVF